MTWDHIVPRSIGGRLQIPSCGYCNGHKALRSVAEWLTSRTLEVRRTLVAGRDRGADPMHERIVLALRDEDLVRIRRDVDYHGS